MSPALDIKNLHIGYPLAKGKELTVGKNINLKIHKGSLTCLMGPNGIGKSTLLRSVTGVQPPLSGSILLDNIDICKLSKKQIAKKASIVLTEKILHASITVSELVSLGRYPYTNWSSRFDESDKKITAKAIADVGLSGQEGAKIAELSDGNAQKAMIARALTQDCPLMVLDEPTAHLDLKNKIDIINLLKDLAHNLNKAVFISSHDLSVILQVCDRLVLMDEKGITEGIPEDLVLTNKIEDVFKLTDFDLKTGYILTKPSKAKISVKGQGCFFSWTERALIRNGYNLTPEANIIIECPTTTIKDWRITSNNVENNNIDSLSSLLHFLEKLQSADA